MVYEDRNLIGGNTPIKEFTAGATIKAGEFVFIANDDGFVDPCVTGSTKTVGVAMNNAAVTEKVSVALAIPGITEYLIEVLAPDTHPMVITCVGKYYGLNVASANHTVNENVTNADIFVIKEYSAVANSKQTAWVGVIAAASQYSGTLEVA